MFTSSIYSGFIQEMYYCVSMYSTYHVFSVCLFCCCCCFLFTLFDGNVEWNYGFKFSFKHCSNDNNGRQEREKSNVEWVRELNMTKNKKRRRQHNTNCNNNANTHTNISVTDKTIYFDEPNWFFPASPFILNALCRSIEICWLILCIIFSSFLFGSLSLYLSMAAFIPNSFHVISVRYKNSFSCDYEIAFPRSSSTHIILSS